MVRRLRRCRGREADGGASGRWASWAMRAAGPIGGTCSRPPSDRRHGRCCVRANAAPDAQPSRRIRAGAPDDAVADAAGGGDASDAPRGGPRHRCQRSGVARHRVQRRATLRRGACRYAHAGIGARPAHAARCPTACLRLPRGLRIPVLLTLHRGDARKPTDPPRRHADTPVTRADKALVPTLAAPGAVDAARLRPAARRSIAVVSPAPGRTLPGSRPTRSPWWCA